MKPTQTVQPDLYVTLNTPSVRNPTHVITTQNVPPATSAPTTCVLERLSAATLTAIVPMVKSVQITFASRNLRQHVKSIATVARVIIVIMGLVLRVLPVEQTRRVHRDNIVTDKTSVCIMTMSALPTRIARLDIIATAPDYVQSTQLLNVPSTTTVLADTTVPTTLVTLAPHAEQAVHAPPTNTATAKTSAYTTTTSVPPIPTAAADTLALADNATNPTPPLAKSTTTAAKDITVPAALV